jgi:hypothetical protein
MLQHNAEAAAGRWSYTVGVNHLTDLTAEEVRQRHLGLQPQPQHRPRHDLWQEEDQAPPSIDWRQRGAVTPVKRRAGCRWVRDDPAVSLIASSAQLGLFCSRRPRGRLGTGRPPTPVPIRDATARVRGTANTRLPKWLSCTVFLKEASAKSSTQAPPLFAPSLRNLPLTTFATTAA